MFLTVDTSITIRAAADAVWDYACKPANWTASNPAEHFGLTFESPHNLPHAGVTFTHRERFCLWLFQSYLNGRQALYDYSFRELRFFKERLEDPASADVP
jgi:hypothetical protein